MKKTIKVMYLTMLIGAVLAGCSSHTTIKAPESAKKPIHQTKTELPKAKIVKITKDTPEPKPPKSTEAENPINEKDFVGTWGDVNYQTGGTHLIITSKLANQLTLELTTVSSGTGNPQVKTTATVTLNQKGYGTFQFKDTGNNVGVGAIQLDKINKNLTLYIKYTQKNSNASSNLFEGTALFTHTTVQVKK